MSLYSSLVGKVKVKEKFKKDVNEVTYGNGWNFCETNEMKMFSNVEECESIPRHMCLGAPIEWNDYPDKHFDEESCIWSFKFSINYEDGTIDRFIELLDDICEEIIYIERCSERYMNLVFRGVERSM